MQVYNTARADVVAAGLDGSPVAQAVRLLMTSRDKWTGTATKLLDALCDKMAEKTTRLKIWPKTAKGLSNVIRRLAPSLRADGLDIEFHHSTDRKIFITKTGQQDYSCISASLSSYRPKAIQGNGFKPDAKRTQVARTDASNIPSSDRKALENKGLGRKDATDAKIQVQSCGTESSEPVEYF